MFPQTEANPIALRAIVIPSSVATTHDIKKWQRELVERILKQLDIVTKDELATIAKQEFMVYSALTDLENEAQIEMPV